MRQAKSWSVTLKSAWWVSSGEDLPNVLLVKMLPLHGFLLRGSELQSKWLPSCSWQLPPSVPLCTLLWAWWTLKKVQKAKLFSNDFWYFFPQLGQGRSGAVILMTGEWRGSSQLAETLTQAGGGRRARGFCKQQLQYLFVILYREALPLIGLMRK